METTIVICLGSIKTSAVAAEACVLGSFQAACSSLLGHIDIFSLTSTCVSGQEVL